MLFKMKILSSSKNIYNIQKCFLPDCEFLKENYGKYCIVIADDRKYIVKLEVCEHKSLSKVIFLDDSVSVYSSFSQIFKARKDEEINFENFMVLRKPLPAKFIEIVVVFDHVFDVIKHHSSDTKLRKVVGEILKLFVVSTKSCVFLGSLPDSQNYNIHAIILTNVDNTNDQIFTVDSNTKISITKCITRLKFQQSQENTNEPQIGGCSKIYEILKETIELSKCDNQNLKLIKKLLLIGPAGCGKTSLIHNVTKHCGFIQLNVSANDINSLMLPDQEKMLKKVFEEAKLYSAIKENCVVLIDDIDLMFVGKSSYSKQLVKQLVTMLEDVENVPGVIVIATTSSPENIDSQLRKPKLFENELELSVPTSEEREDIIKNILNYCRIEINDDILFNLAKWTPGFVGADIRLLILEGLIIFNKKKAVMNLSNNKLLLESFKEALKKVIPSALRGAVGLCTKNDTTFSQIGGLENVKKVLDLSVRLQLENPERFHKLGVPLTKGILLYGPPGCAKTTLVKALANQCNTTFLATSAADLYSPFVGDAEKKIVQLFSQARLGSPSILFIDEIDAVVGSKSGDREHGVQERILSTLLIEMDGVGLNVHSQDDNALKVLGNKTEASLKKEINNGVIVVGATNRPQLIDDALKRPGRFDRLLYVPPPDESERLRILTKITEKMPLHESVNLKILAKFTNFYSGADLKNLCQESGLYALKSSDMSAPCICQEHFEHVLSEYKPSLNEKIIRSYESF